MTRPSVGWMVIALALFNPAGHAATRARFGAESVLKDAGVRISASAFHTCQVKDDGTVRCWGENADGRLGDGTTQDRLSPVTVVGLTNVVAVSVGQRAFQLAVRVSF